MSTLSPITMAESQRLIELEEIIEKGVGTFIKVGEALAEIRDKKLYRKPTGGYTFEDYCREEWDMTPQYATQLCRSARVAAMIESETKVSVSRETHVRPLTKLETPEQQRAAFAIAQIEGSGSPTAKHFTEAAAQVLKSSESATTPRRSNFRPSSGLHYADLAIETLERIQPTDKERAAAFEKVRQYLSTKQ